MTRPRGTRADAARRLAAAADAPDAGCEPQLSERKSSSYAGASSDSRPHPTGEPDAPPRPDGAFDAALLAGIAAYRRHPFVRDLPDPAVLWQEAEIRLLDFGPGGGIPVLFEPSLVNRGTILNLTEQRSMLRSG